MKNNIKVGDTFEVEMLPNKNQGKPICRIEGMICFIHHLDRENPNVGENWFVSIHEIKDKFAYVLPIWREKTASEVYQLKNDALKKLSEKITHKEKFIKPKRNYQYLASYEMR